MKTTMLKAYILISCILHTTSSNRVVNTNLGPVQGVTVSNGELTIEAFLGIPYAEPPIGDLRFKRPSPKTPWSEVLTASKLPPVCMQVTGGFYFEPNTEGMTEDCLYLNLWVPDSSATSGDLKPVMVFIHGGAFVCGGSNMQLYDGTRLAEKGDVIVATLNYRLGAFGFLFLDENEPDDNVGIFDQIMAMRWIKDNAKAFGGDPDSITLFGESAGSMMITGHLSSPLSRDLFRRVILQSGSLTMPMIDISNTIPLKVSRKLAEFTDCVDEDTEKIKSCLREVPPGNLSQIVYDLQLNHRLFFFPRIGGEFLPKPLIQLLKEGDFKDAEMLVGNNGAEGTFFMAVSAPDVFGQYGNKRVSMPSSRLAYHLLRKVLKAIGFGREEEKQIAEYYIGSIKNGSSQIYIDAIASAIGDFFIACGSYFQAELIALRNPVYFYRMTRRPSSTPLAEWMNTTHFDELQYVFGNPLFDNFTPEEEVFSDRVMRRWIAFAKTGNPNPPGELEWPRFHRDDQKYLELTDVEAVHDERPDEGRCEIWRRKYDALVDTDVLSRFKRASGSSANVDVLAVGVMLFTAALV